MYPHVKRVLDFLFASAALGALCPLLVLTAVYIRLESSGPVLVLNSRVGKGRKTFRLARFRTMHVSEDGFSIVLATKSDARITPTGRFVRRTGLVSLPTLWNIVRGDMSFIGPRPLVPTLGDDLLAAYPARSNVRPGLFSPQRLHGFKGEALSIDELKNVLEWDDDYARRQSLLLDLQILFRVARPRQQKLDHGTAT